MIRNVTFMSKNNEKLLSDTISWLRFPLIVLVVLIHVPMGNWEGAPIASLICEWGIQKGIATVAVPLFFLISGFLYFYKVKTWTIEVYEKKSLARVKTLLVPFLVWSIPATIYSWIVCHAGLSAGTFWELHKTPAEIFWGVLGFFRPDLGDGLPTPLAAQFWFVRDLFVVCMCAPFWRFLLSKIPKISISFLCAYWFFYHGSEIPGLNTQAVFFFCLGAFFSIRGRNLVSDVSHFGGGALGSRRTSFLGIGAARAPARVGLGVLSCVAAAVDCLRHRRNYFLGKQRNRNGAANTVSIPRRSFFLRFRSSLFGMVHHPAGATSLNGLCAEFKSFGNHRVLFETSLANRALSVGLLAVV